MTKTKFIPVIDFSKKSDISKPVFEFPRWHGKYAMARNMKRLCAEIGIELKFITPDGIKDEN